MSALDTKNRLYDLLNANVPDDVKLSNIGEIITVLTHTEGFWIELRYAYKACEIASATRHRIDGMLDETTHPKRVKRLVALRDKLISLESLYFGHQQALNRPAE